MIKHNIKMLYITTIGLIVVIELKKTLKAFTYT